MNTLWELETLDDPRAVGWLRGKAGVANAKVAYTRYKAFFAGPRWRILAKSGAKAQRLLWASHRGEESSVQRYDVCRGADRSRHDKHHPARYDGCVPRPW